MSSSGRTAHAPDGLGRVLERATSRTPYWWLGPFGVLLGTAIVGRASGDAAALVVPLGWVIAAATGATGYLVATRVTLHEGGLTVRRGNGKSQSVPWVAVTDVRSSAATPGGALDLVTDQETVTLPGSLEAAHPGLFAQIRALSQPGETISTTRRESASRAGKVRVRSVTRADKAAITAIVVALAGFAWVAVFGLPK